MGKAKAVLLHLLAVAAGWGIVAALRPVVGSWQVGEKLVPESRAPSKTGRVRSTAEIAEGQKLLQRFTEDRQGDDPSGADADPGPEISLRDIVDVLCRDTGFDPAAPAPSWDTEGRSEEERSTTFKYHLYLHRVLEMYLEGEHGPDLAHAFRYGRVEAGALYNSLVAHLPGAAADHTLRHALYVKLAPLDPVRAATLLQPLTVDEAADERWDLVATRAETLTPDTAFALLSPIPTTQDPAGIDRRELAWDSITPEFLRRYGSDYLHWVEQLPSGPDREEATAAVLTYMKKDDVPGYRRIRALVTDPRTLASFPPR